MESVRLPGVLVPVRSGRAGGLVDRSCLVAAHRAGAVGVCRGVRAARYRAGSGSGGGGAVTAGERALWAAADAERVIAWSMAVVAACIGVLTLVVLVAAVPAIAQWVRDALDTLRES